MRELPGELHAIGQDGLDRLVGELDVAEILQVRNDLPTKSAGVARGVVDDDVVGSNFHLLEDVVLGETGFSELRDPIEFSDRFLCGVASVDDGLNGSFHRLAIGFGGVTGDADDLSVDSDLHNVGVDFLEQFDRVLLGLGLRDVDAFVAVVLVRRGCVFSFCFVFFGVYRNRRKPFRINDSMRSVAPLIFQFITALCGGGP